MGKVKINWNEAYQEFLVTDGMSLKDIAEKYGISYSRVKKVSMTRKWTITKSRVWEKAREMAINETADSAKELIIRQSKMARYLQEKGMELLKKYLKKTKVTEMSPYFLLRMIIVGLKIERDLYSEELKTRYRYEERFVCEGHSEAVTEAIKETRKKYPHLWNAQQ